MGVVITLLPAQYANPPLLWLGNIVRYSFQVSIVLASRGLRRVHTVAVKSAERSEVLIKRRTANEQNIFATKQINSSQITQNHAWKTNTRQDYSAHSLRRFPNLLTWKPFLQNICLELTGELQHLIFVFQMTCNTDTRLCITVSGC